MLLEEKTPCERRCPRRWVTVVASALVAAGLVAGGLGLRTVAAEEKTPDPEQKVEPKKDSEKKTEPKKKDRPRRGLGLFAPGQGLDELFDQLGPMLDDEAMKELRQQMQEARRQLEQLRRQAGPNAALPLFPDAPWAVPGLRAARQHPPRLGVQVRPPSQTLVDQLDLPKDQGVVLEEVGPNSPAGKAGLKSHDILLELAGKTVPSKVEEFARMVAGIEANKPVDAVVLRKGKKETIQGLKLPEVKAEAAPPRPVVPGLANRFLRGVPGGARGMTSITRNNDEFTTKHRAGDVTITIKGKVEQGKAQVSEVVIDADGQKSTYDSVDKVPAAHREKVRKLAEMSARGTARFPLD